MAASSRPRHSCLVGRLYMPTSQQPSKTPAFLRHARPTVYSSRLRQNLGPAPLVVAGRLNRRDNPQADRLGKRRPALDDHVQIGVNGRVWCADCTGFCSVFGPQLRFPRSFSALFESCSLRYGMSHSLAECRNRRHKSMIRHGLASFLTGSCDWLRARAAPDFAPLLRRLRTLARNHRRSLASSASTRCDAGRVP